MYAARYAAENPDKPAIVMATSGEVVTFGQYEAASNRMAHLLMRRDPLRGAVHLSVPAVAGHTIMGILAGASWRLGRRFFTTSQKPRGV